MLNARWIWIGGSVTLFVSAGMVGAGQTEIVSISSRCLPTSSQDSGTISQECVPPPKAAELIAPIA
jgi:hypothetical protein